MITPRETAALLETQRRRVQALYVIHTALFAASFALLFLWRQAAYVLALANVLFYIAGVRRADYAFQKQANQQRIRFGLCRGMDTVSFTGKETFAAKEFAGLCILPSSGKAGGVMLRQGFTAHWQGLTLRAAEVTTHYSATGAGSRPDYRFLSGTLLHLKARDTAVEETSFVLVSKGLLDLSVARDFYGQTGLCPPPHQDSDAPSLLYMAENAEPLEDGLDKRLNSLLGCGVPLALRRQSGGVTVFLRGVFFTGRRHIRDEVTAEWLGQNPFPQRDAALAVAAYRQGHHYPYKEAVM